MILYSIKTVDGNRYDYHRENGKSPFDNEDEDWVYIIAKDGTCRMFLRKNIVCVTSRKEDHA